MNAIFGIPTTTIMLVLLAAFAICLASGAWIALRTRIIFKLGVRNIPRRPAQTALIVIGLMLSTLIIAAAFTTGDTLNSSIRAEVLNILGQTDERVVPTSGETDTGPPSGAVMPMHIYDYLEMALADEPSIEGIMPFLSESVPAINTRTQLSEPALNLTGLDPVKVELFGGVRDLRGDAIDLAALPQGSVILSSKAAEKLEARVGDVLTIYTLNQPRQLTVHAIARDSLMTGYAVPGSAGGLTMPLQRAQDLLGHPGRISSIEVTNPGGASDGVKHSDAAIAALDGALESFRYQAIPVKKNDLAMAEETGNVFLTLFIVFGLFSVSVGVLLIFLIFVMLAAERKSEMGMARAIGMKRGHLTRMFIAEGLSYDLAAALVGAALGVAVAFVMAGFMGRMMGDYFSITPTASWRSLIIAYTLGVVVTFITIVVSSWKVSRLNIVEAIRDVPEATQERENRRWLVFGIVAIALGTLLTWSGITAALAFPLMLGLSLIPLGFAIALRRFGFPARLLYSVAAILILVLWLLPENVFYAIFPETTGNIEMFFLSGIMMVGAATVLIVWNAPVFTWLIGQAGRGFSRWLPAVKTAVAYPLERRGRTGMTIAMFSLVIFALVMMATLMATATELVYGNDDASAGWDIQAVQSPVNAIDDLRVTLAASGVDTTSIEAVGRLSIVNQAGSQVRMAGDEAWSSYMIVGADNEFLNHSSLPLLSRATGYDSDEAVWAAVRDSVNLAVVDNNALAGQMMFGSTGFQLRGVSASDDVFAPIDIEIGEPLTGGVQRITIIGITDPKVVTFPGITMSQVTYGLTFDERASTSFLMHNVRLQPGVDAENTARSIESTLLAYGVQATTYREILDEYSSMTMGFLRLIEGFMLLGLVVGVASLGVIAFRSVVERRQQIGMLRAIGFQRRMVSASFMIEACLLTILGALSGTILALLLSWQLTSSDYFFGSSEDPAFIIPALDISAFVVIAIVASLLMAWIPARRAARVPIAEALRYE